MRRVLVASLLSCVAMTAAAAVDKPATPASGSTATIVSTGVTAPQLADPAILTISTSDKLTSYPNPARVVLKVSLDATGSPTHVEVVQALTPQVDALVVKAVSQTRWRPAVLDNQTIPSDVNLIVEVQH